MRDVLDFKLHTQWVRTVLSRNGKQDQDLQYSLCGSSARDPKSSVAPKVDAFFEADPSFSPEVQALLNFERTTQSPWEETSGITKAKDLESCILNDSETFFDISPPGK